MLRSILAICLFATTPVAVYSAATWPNDRKVELAAREQREQFFDDLAVRQRDRRESDRRTFDGNELPSSRHTW